MNYGKAALWIVERLFDVAELVVKLSEKKKKPEPSHLTLRDLVEMKRQQDEGVRRSSAPTVVIPPPSEREKRR